MHIPEYIMSTCVHADLISSRMFCSRSRKHEDGLGKKDFYGRPGDQAKLESISRRRFIIPLLYYSVHGWGTRREHVPVLVIANLG